MVFIVHWYTLRFDILSVIVTAAMMGVDCRSVEVLEVKIERWSVVIVVVTRRRSSVGSVRRRRLESAHHKNPFVFRNACTHARTHLQTHNAHLFFFHRVIYFVSIQYYFPLFGFHGFSLTVSQSAFVVVVLERRRRFSLSPSNAVAILAARSVNRHPLEMASAAAAAYNQNRRVPPTMQIQKVSKNTGSPYIRDGQLAGRATFSNYFIKFQHLSVLHFFTFIVTCRYCMLIQYLNCS